MLSDIESKQTRMEKPERTTEEILASAVEMATGKSIAYLRNTPIDEFRREVEKKHGAPMKFVSAFPFIGRGHALRDRLVTGGQVAAELEETLRGRRQRIGDIVIGAVGSLLATAIVWFFAR